jgi:flagellar biosynthesis/type III secretory pathway protein FliH
LQAGAVRRRFITAAPEGAGIVLPELDDADRAARARAAERTEAEDAYERGQMAGMRDGAARAEEHLRPLVASLAHVIESIASAAADAARDREHDLQGLALAVARKLVQRELTADPERVRELVGRAIELMPPATPLEARLHPDDLAAIGGELERQHAPRHPGVLQWIPDPALARGDFVIESPMRIVDGRTDVALRNLYERLEHD